MFRYGRLTTYAYPHKAVTLVLCVVRALPNIVCALLAFGYASIQGLPAKRIHVFGWKCALRFLASRDLAGFERYIVNPISLYRYLEFDFALRHIRWEDVRAALDVSSPNMLSAYLIGHFPQLVVNVINPDSRDVAVSRNLFKKCLGKSLNYAIACSYAGDIKGQDESYDVVYSICVAEHVIESEERPFLLKLWSLLKPGGTLVITVPVATVYMEEFRQDDVFNLGYPRNNQGQIFFQRRYDSTALERRIFDVLDKRPEYFEVFGVIRNWSWDNYVQRWMARGLKETARDPYYAAKYIARCSRTEQFPERGICCMAFVKPGSDWQDGHA